MTRELASPSVKQRLAALRHLFDWLVNGQVMPVNPAHSVRGPRHVVLAVPEPAPPAPAADYRERYQQLTGRSLDLCPCCGGRMIQIGVIPRASTSVAAAPWNTS